MSYYGKKCVLWLANRTTVLFTLTWEVWKVLGLIQTPQPWPGPDPRSLCWRTDCALSSKSARCVYGLSIVGAFFCLPLCVAEAFCSLSNSTITLLYVLRGLESKSTRYTIQKVNRRLLLIGVVSLYWFQRAHCNLKSFSVLVSFFYITSVVLSVSMHRTNVFC